MRKTLFFVCAMATILLISAAVYAQIANEANMPGSPLMNLETYRLNLLQADKNQFLKVINAQNEPTDIYPVDDKMAAGLINTTTSWTEIPKKVTDVSDKDNVLAGVTIGLTEGIISGLTRGAAGVIDMATFSIPPYDEPLMKPEYKVVNPDQGFKIDLLKW